MKYSIIIALFALCAFAGESSVATDSSQKRTLAVIPVSGTVDAGMAAYLARGVRDALVYDNPLIILEMDTWGGGVDAAIQIVDTMLNLGEKVQTVAYVKTKAISAGALIALSCSKLFMKSGTTIGDCAPLMQTQEGPKMLGEKVQSPLRAKFRTMARKNNYPVSPSESMVTQDMVVYRISIGDSVAYMDSVEYGDLTSAELKKVTSRKTAVARGELLTMDDVEALEFGFSTATIKSIEEIAPALGISNFEIVRIEETWSESFVRFIGKIAPILMLLGIAGIYIETKSPGIGFPGILGACCIALVLGGQYMAGLADYTELFLVFVGFVLLAAEIFIIPGFGLAGIAGIAAISVGLMLSLQDFVLPKPEFPWQRQLFYSNLRMLVFSLAGALVLVVLFFKYLFPRLSHIVKGPTLDADLKNSHVTKVGEITVAVGDMGVVTKTLRPAGQVRFGDDEMDVLTEGEFVEAGARITVVELRGNVIVVLPEKKND